MSSYLDAAALVLLDKKRPLGVWDILSFAWEGGYLSDKLTGKTPYKTMQARISEEIVRYGERSRFVRIAPGVFFHRDLLPDHPEMMRASSLYRGRPRRPPKPQEKVLCIPREALDKFGRFQGIQARHAEFCQQLLKPEVIRYVPRLEAEATTEFKQVVSYASIHRTKQILTFKRGVFNRVAKFLRGQKCVGFGGHVTESDLTLFDFDDFGVTNNVVREIGEELSLPREDLKRLALDANIIATGILNDDSSLNGQRHIAVLFQYEVSDSDLWDKPKKGETSITQLSWQDLNPLKLDLREYEYWSQLLLRRLVPEVANTQPTYRIVRKIRFEKKHILCVVGAIGSGKSAATRILTDSLGYHEINSGRVIAEILGIPAVPHTSRAEFQKVSWEFIQSDDGPSILADALIEKIGDIDTDRIVVDGIRQIETLRHLKKRCRFMSCATLYIHASPDLAFTLFRQRENSSISHNEFMNIFTASVERDLPLLIENADAVLYNWGGKQAYEIAMIEMMKKLPGGVRR